jgi:hypothetical protein
MTPIGYSGARGKLTHEKNLTMKVSIQTPFKSNLQQDFMAAVYLF